MQGEAGSFFAGATNIPLVDIRFLVFITSTVASHQSPVANTST